MIHDYKVDQASETGLFLPSRFHPYPEPEPEIWMIWNSFPIPYIN